MCVRRAKLGSYIARARACGTKSQAAWPMEERRLTAPRLGLAGPKSTPSPCHHHHTTTTSSLVTATTTTKREIYEGGAWHGWPFEIAICIGRAVGGDRVCTAEGRGRYDDGRSAACIVPQVTTCGTSVLKLVCARRFQALQILQHNTKHNAARGGKNKIKKKKKIIFVYVCVCLTFFCYVYKPFFFFFFFCKSSRG